jgi:hypothetical protein
MLTILLWDLMFDLVELPKTFERSFERFVMERRLLHLEKCMRFSEVVSQMSNSVATERRRPIGFVGGGDKCSTRR